MPEADRQALAWAREHWPFALAGELTAEALAVQGSARRFLRLASGGRSLILMINPHNQAENKAWLGLARLLALRQIAAPRALAVDQAQGWLLVEDVGAADLLAQVRLINHSQAADRQAALYRLYLPVLDLLARLQGMGPDLDLSLCFDGSALTAQFLRAREADYFLHNLVAGAAAWPAGQWPQGLDEELDDICRQAAQAQPQGLTHRDFQSTNLIFSEQGRLAVVDFQGARLGPAQYDLASVLNDPYTDLPLTLRHSLRQHYVSLLQERGLDVSVFAQGWPAVALCRIMQALGAYAFLSRVRGRKNFARFVPAALNTMQGLLAEPQNGEYKALSALLAGLRRREMTF